MLLSPFSSFSASRDATVKQGLAEMEFAVERDGTARHGTCSGRGRGRGGGGVKTIACSNPAQHGLVPALTLATHPATLLTHQSV